MYFSDRNFEPDLATQLNSTTVLGGLLSHYLQAAEGALSRNTTRALRADVAIFTDWCGRHAFVPLPAEPGTVAAFIDALTPAKAPATIRRYVSSVAAVHKAANVANPSESTVVKLALQRMHRKKGRRQAQVQALTWPLRTRLIEASGNRLIDIRNRALLAVAYDTLLRRSELISLQVSDLCVEVDGCATLLVRSSKTDRDGRGAMAYLARDSVMLVTEWIEHGGVVEGRLFRSVRKSGSVGRQLDASQVPRIYKAMARKAGLPESVAQGLAGHSTRVGAVQDMIACGIEMPAIMQAGRWKSPAMVTRYGEQLLARRNATARLARHQQRLSPDVTLQSLASESVA